MAETPLARVGQTDKLEIIWRPFELRPEPVPLATREYLENAWATSVTPMAQQMGVEMGLPPVQSRTRLAHEAAAFAQQSGKMAEMADALFRAFFQQGRDIGQVDVLCEVGGTVGLDPTQMRLCLEERQLEEAVGEELAMTRSYGITAVPTFIVGERYLLRGLVSEEQLRRVVRMCKGEGLIQPE